MALATLAKGPVGFILPLFCQPNLSCHPKRLGGDEENETFHGHGSFLGDRPTPGTFPP